MIPALVPALSLAGFIVRGKMSVGDVGIVESDSPGFVARACLDTQDTVYSQLRKRYDTAAFGQSMGPPSGAGIAPPPIALVGVPVRGDLELVLQCTLGGPLGTATFKMSLDGGNTWTTSGLVTGPSVLLPGTGVAAAFPAGVYDASNLYTSETPVRRAVLRWIAFITAPEIWDQRGVNPQDPGLLRAKDRKELAERQIEEAANSEVGLFDLPRYADTSGSGITQGSPLVYSETSPWEWTDKQACRGERYDDRR